MTSGNGTYGLGGYGSQGAGSYGSGYGLGAQGNDGTGQPTAATLTNPQTGQQVQSTDPMTVLNYVRQGWGLLSKVPGVTDLVDGVLGPGSNAIINNPIGAAWNAATGAGSSAAGAGAAGAGSVMPGTAGVDAGAGALESGGAGLSAAGDAASTAGAASSWLGQFAGPAQLAAVAANLISYGVGNRAMPSAKGVGATVNADGSLGLTQPKEEDQPDAATMYGNIANAARAQGLSGFHVGNDTDSPNPYIQMSGGPKYHTGFTTSELDAAAQHMGLSADDARMLTRNALATPANGGLAADAGGMGTWQTSSGHAAYDPNFYYEPGLTNAQAAHPTDQIIARQQQGDRDQQMDMGLISGDRSGPSAAQVRQGMGEDEAAQADEYARRHAENVAKDAAWAAGYGKRTAATGGRMRRDDGGRTAEAPSLLRLIQDLIYAHGVKAPNAIGGSRAMGGRYEDGGHAVNPNEQDAYGLAQDGQLYAPGPRPVDPRLPDAAQQAAGLGLAPAYAPDEYGLGPVQSGGRDSGSEDLMARMRGDPEWMRRERILNAQMPQDSAPPGPDTSLLPSGDQPHGPFILPNPVNPNNPLGFDPAPNDGSTPLGPGTFPHDDGGASPLGPRPPVGADPGAGPLGPVPGGPPPAAPTDPGLGLGPQPPSDQPQFDPTQFIGPEFWRPGDPPQPWQGGGWGDGMAFASGGQVDADPRALAGIAGDYLTAARSQGLFQNLSPQQIDHAVNSAIAETVRACGGRIGRAMGGGVPMVRGGEVPNGSYIVPAFETSALGDGSTEAGAAALHRALGGMLVRGPGSGRSDSVPFQGSDGTGIDLSNGEVVIPPAGVAKAGGADALDKQVMAIRRGTVKKLRKLPAPKR